MGDLFFQVQNSDNSLFPLQKSRKQIKKLQRDENRWRSADIAKLQKNLIVDIHITDLQLVFYEFPRIYGCLVRCPELMNLENFRDGDQYGRIPTRPWPRERGCTLSWRRHLVAQYSMVSIHLDPGGSVMVKKGFFAKKTAGAEPLKDGRGFYLSILFFFYFVRPNHGTKTSVHPRLELCHSHLSTAVVHSLPLTLSSLFFYIEYGQNLSCIFLFPNSKWKQQNNLH